MPDTSRLFFALWPDDKTRKTLSRLTQSVSAQTLKWVKPYNFHVTLVFLGSVDKDTEALIKLAAADINAQPFTLTFDALNYWSKPKVLCLTCPQPAPEPAVMLASQLRAAAENLGLHTDERPYTPHITLARHVRHLPQTVIEPVTWQAEAFCLVESCSEPEGVFYKVIQQWPFIKPGANPGQYL